MKIENQSFQVFYDGACYLCSTEIDHYKKKISSVPIEYIDISNPIFKASECGLDEKQLQLKMHVRCEDGTVKTGVDAFMQIWRRIPAYQKLSWALDREWIKPFLRIGYFIFARIRPYLPKKKKGACDTGRCDVK